MIDEQIKKRAIQSRREGLSIKEISLKHKIAQSTASVLLRDVILNDKIKVIL